MYAVLRRLAFPVPVLKVSEQGLQDRLDSMRDVRLGLRRAPGHTGALAGSDGRQSGKAKYLTGTDDSGTLITWHNTKRLRKSAGAVGSNAANAANWSSGAESGARSFGSITTRPRSIASTDGHGEEASLLRGRSAPSGAGARTSPAAVSSDSRRSAVFLPRPLRRVRRPGGDVQDGSLPPYLTGTDG